jgi:hypothetical protein
LGEIYPDSKDFCNQMGMLVNTDDQYCYNGETWFSKYGKAEAKVVRPIIKKPKVKKPKEPKGWYDRSVRYLSSWFYVSPIIFSILYILCALGLSAAIIF